MDPSRVISYVTGAIFVAIALRLAARSGREPGARWAGAAFGALASVSVLSSVADALWAETPAAVQKILLTALLLFPLLLLRFTSTLAPIPKLLARTGVAATGVLVLWGLVLPVIPEGRQSWSAAFVAFLVCLLVQWTALSVTSVALLWQEAEGQPSVARRRMRFLAVAVLVLNIALIGAFTLTGAGQGVVQLLGGLSALGFLVAFAPPPWLRGVWRRPEEAHLQEAVAELMSARSPAEVAGALLPHVVAVMGGRAALLDEKGDPIACYAARDDGTVEEVLEPSERGLAGGVGISRSLMVWTGPAAPLFAGEELALLVTLGTLSDLAVDRAHLFESERQRSSSFEELADQLGEANRALEEQVRERQEAQLAADAARQEAERANRTKSEFLSRMSHELRTPLNSILGFTQLLEADDLTDDQQESVHHVLKGGRHLLTLIDEVLDISRVESGRMTISTEPVEIAEVVPEVVSLLRPMAAERDISMTLGGADLDGLHVLADRQRLKQVLINLVGNGIKYNRHAGSVTVTVERSGPVVSIGVTDTGPGLTPEKIDRLFTPFDRLGAEMTPVQGTGLGLALSRGLVELMGGTIKVASTEGRGSTFSLELPATAPVESVEAGHSPGSPEETRLHGSLTVLYVEDNLANVQLVERIFRDYPKVQLLTAMQGRIGLELARHHQPDLVLLDVHLPDMGGDVVLKRLRAEPGVRETTIVVLSADATQSQIRKLRDAGADDYLTKPIDVRRFKELVESVMIRQTAAVE